MFRVKPSVFFFAVVLLYSAVLAGFQGTLTVTKIIDFDTKFANVNRQLLFELPEKDVYLLKLWGVQLPGKIYLNGEEVASFRSRDRSGLKEAYVRVDPGLSKKGQNMLEIISKGSYSVRIRNFYGATGSKGIYVLFDSSRFLNFRPHDFVQVLAFSFFIQVLCWVFLYSVIRVTFSNFNFKLFFMRFSIVNSVLFFIIYVGNLSITFAHYRVIFLFSTFWSSCILFLFLANFIFMCWFIDRQLEVLVLKAYIIKWGLRLKGLPYQGVGPQTLDSFLSLLNIHYRQVPEQYLILIFIFLILFCMICLSLKIYTIANWASYIAYFFLVGGVIIKFRKLLGETDKR